MFEKIDDIPLASPLYPSEDPLFISELAPHLWWLPGFGRLNLLWITWSSLSGVVLLVIGIFPELVLEALLLKRVDGSRGKFGVQCLFIGAGVAQPIVLVLMCKSIAAINQHPDVSKSCRRLLKYPHLLPKLAKNKQLLKEGLFFANVLLLLMTFCYILSLKLYRFALCLYLTQSIPLHACMSAGFTVLLWGGYCTWLEIAAFMDDYMPRKSAIFKCASAEFFSELVQLHIQLEEKVDKLCGAMWFLLWLMIAFVGSWACGFFLIGILLFPQHDWTLTSGLGVSAAVPGLAITFALYKLSVPTDLFRRVGVMDDSIPRRALEWAAYMQTDSREVHLAYMNFCHYIRNTEAGVRLSPSRGVMSVNGVLRLASQVGTILSLIYYYTPRLLLTEAEVAKCD